MAWVIGIGVFLFALYLLFSYPKAVGGFLLVCAIVIVGVVAWNNNQDKKRLAKRQSVQITIGHNLVLCGADDPLFVNIFNGSDDTLEKVSFDIRGRLQGHSEPLYKGGYPRHSSDKIIASGEQWSSCWPIPKTAYGASEKRLASNPPETLFWQVTSISPTFEGGY